MATIPSRTKAVPSYSGSRSRSVGERPAVDPFLLVGLRFDHHGPIVVTIWTLAPTDWVASNFTYEGAGRLADAWTPSHRLTYAFAATGRCGAQTTA